MAEEIITADELAALRAEHPLYVGFGGVRLCMGHNSIVGWPCAAIKALDTLAGRGAEVERLRAALEGYVDRGGCAGMYAASTAGCGSCLWCRACDALAGVLAGPGGIDG